MTDSEISPIATDSAAPTNASSVISSGASEVARAVDSLTANEFAVELDGEPITGVLRVIGLSPYKLSVSPSLTKLTREPLTLIKMVQRDASSPFNRWHRETVATRGDIMHPRRRLDVIALDEGVETRRWQIHGAWISGIRYSDFDTGSVELVQENYTIEYDSIEEIWPDA
jgi:Arc/MetJ family transcription regulator